MSKVTNFGFANESESTVTLKPIALGLTTNYALVTDEPSEVRLDNKTAPLDQGEIVSFKAREIPKVATSLKNYYPAPVTTGIQYVVEAEEMLSTTVEGDATYRVDEPITAYLTIRHPKSGNITQAHIVKVMQRLIGACLNDKGEWRFEELMRSALKPSN